MNPWIDAAHPAIHYYDGDYPSPNGLFPENFDEATGYQGLAFDLGRYAELAAEAGGPVLELCCGSGRVAIPLARNGHRVVGVDVSRGMLDLFRDNLAREEPETRARIAIIEQDACALSLDERGFRLAIIAFNSLLCITEMEKQVAMLRSAASHLAKGALLAVDAMNPLKLNPHGDPVPRMLFARKNPRTGNTYSRFAMAGPIDAEQRQRLHGWYDEIDAGGVVRRRFYSMHWRPIFRFELELMLRLAGLEPVSFEGGHRKEPFQADSRHIFAIARKPSS